MILWAAVVAALAAALVSAVLLARRDHAHWPVAACLAAGLVIDLVVGYPEKDAQGRVIGGWALAAYLGMHKPWGPAQVALFHLSNALVSLWPATLAATAWAVFSGQKDKRPEPKSEPFASPCAASSPERMAVAVEDSPAFGASQRVRAGRKLLPASLAVKAIVGTWLALNAAVIASWPVPGATVQRALLGAEVAALVAGAVAVARGFGPWTWPRIATLWLLGIEVVVVTVGPYRTSVYERWDLARVAYALCFVGLAIGQVVAWRRR